jgi:hypothetical protein
MAKNLVRNYTFTASAKTVAIAGNFTLNQLLLITNVTRNTIIYNFADSNLGATRSYNSATDLTTFTLTYNTAASMANADIIQIYVDSLFNETRPDQALMDPVDKQRVSTPQALIDTDFEYGTQISKWENLVLTNNRPFAFSVPTQIPAISGMTMNQNSRTVTVTLSSGSAPTVGTPITVQDTYLIIANGNYLIETGGGTNTFTYTARGTNTTTITSIFDANKTNVFRGQLYTSASIGTSVAANGLSYTGSLINVVTTVPHGLSLGNEIAISGSTGATANSPTGSFIVANIKSPTTFGYYVPTGSVPTGNLTGTSTTYIFARPQGQVLHRPFDGGVQFSSNGSSNFEHTIRQTRRYFRYQSGKGIQVSSGTILKPNLQIDILTSSGTTVTVQTKEQHNILPGDTIIILGANEAAYNGTFTVSNVTGFNTFTYTALTVPSAATASGIFYLSIVGWYGASNKLGVFDNQNGLFFEFDGQVLNAVRRTSTFQLSGEVTVTAGSNTVTQTNVSFPTIFSKQLTPGDYIVIRGASYRVIDIASDTSMTISPSYRGATAQFAIVSKTQDFKFPQSTWNLDKMDGTGPSGYNLDLSKMQMFFIDYSWYGAGVVRWGLRGANGAVTYCHRLLNNNLNTEAYMRSGNLPARYESITQPPYTTTTATFNIGDTTLSVSSSANFPLSGTLCIRNASTYEYVNYEGTGSNTFSIRRRAQSGSLSTTLTMAAGSNIGVVASTASLQPGMRVLGPAFPDGTFIAALSSSAVILTQAATGSNPVVQIAPMGVNSASLFTFSATAPTAVELAFPTFAPSISHWGTSVIMDGRFDDDKSLIFTYGQTRATTIAVGQTRALFSIRISPSVDNGLPAAFGARELTNRMQLVLRQLGIATNQPISGSAVNLLIKANLNGAPSGSVPIAWTNAVSGSATEVNSSLAQIADYAGQVIQVIGGETTAGFFVDGTSTSDLSLVRDLGNSILGGGGLTSNTQIYPDGPDVLTFIAQNVGVQTVNVFGRLGWTEAQA